MGWDYIEYTKPCLCGKGMIRIVDRSNDWGQTSHDETILCPECKDRNETAKSLKQERLGIAKTKISLLITYFRENYTHLLLKKLENTRSKKAVWQMAYDLGIEDCALSRFYKYYKDKNTYINELICWDRFEKIMTTLDVSDQRISEMFEDTKKS